jgi:hypothetical protein
VGAVVQADTAAAKAKIAKTFFMIFPYLDLIHSPARLKSVPAPLTAPPTVPHAVNTAAVTNTIKYFIIFSKKL